MTYFHPFTLNPSEADEDVPFLGNLCLAGKNWHQSLLHWFDGNILCEEVKRYIYNFLVVTRTRPNDEENEHTDDDSEDEELVVDKYNFDEIVKTRIGMGPRKKNDEIGTANGVHAEDAVPETAQEVFDKAREMWSLPAPLDGKEKPSDKVMTDEELKQTLAAAAASQKQETTGAGFASPQNKKPVARKSKNYTASDIWAWYIQVKARKDKYGNPEIK